MADEQDTSSLGPRIPADSPYAEQMERMERLSTPYKQSTPFEKERPFYGTPSEGAIGAPVGGLPTFYDPQLGAPAVFGEPDVEYEDFSLFGLKVPGVSYKTEQVFSLNDIDPSKISQIVSVNEVYDYSNPENIAHLGRQTGFLNRDNQYIPFTAVKADDRIKQADLGGAVKYVQRMEGADDIVTTLPWEAVLAKRIEVPSVQELKDRQKRIPIGLPGVDLFLPPTQHQKLMGFNKLVATIPNYAEKDLRMAEAMRALNLGLIEQSDQYPELKDARTRLQILDYTRSIGGYDYKKIIPEYGRTVFRGALGLGGWFIGEGVQAMSLVPGLFSKSAQIPDSGIFSSQDRQEAISTFIPSYADGLQRRLRDNGVDVSYGTAEYLARYSMSLPPRIIGNTIETYMPTGLASKAKSSLSAADYAAFKLYRENAVKAGRTDVDDFNFLNEFINDNKASFTSRQLNNILSSKSVNKLLGGRPAKWARVGLVSRLNIGKSLDEMNMPVERREAYTSMLNLRDTTVQNKNKLDSIIAAENRSPTPSEIARMERYDRTIKQANRDMLAEIAAENVPPFMRTMAKQNSFFLIGAATGGELVQALGGDPALGEGLGMLAGLATLGLSNTNEALKWVNSTFDSPAKKQLDSAEFVAMGINTFDPEYSEAILTRVGYVRELRSAMISEGVPEDVINLSVGQLTGLAILQSLDATTRQNISAKQLQKFGPEVQELINVHATEQALVVELRKVYSRMSENTYEEGSAAMRMQKLIGEAIEFAESDIQQREGDFNDLIQMFSTKMKGMIGDTMGKSLDQTDLNRRTIENFDETLSQLVDIGVGFSDNTVEAVREIAMVRTGEVLEIANAKASQALAELGDVASGQRAAQGILPEGGLKVSQRAVKITADDIPRFDTGAKITSAILETKHFRDREVAAAGFRVLDREQFVDADNNPVGSNPYVDGAPLMDGLMKAIGLDTGVNLLDFVTGKTVSSATVNASVMTLNNRAEEFFGAMAEEGEDIADTIKNMVELASSDASFASQFKQLSQLKGSKDALIGAMYQRHLANQDGMEIDTMRLSYNQLRKFDSMFSEMGQRARSRGNREALNDYSQMSENVKRLFNEFVVDDADGNPVSVGQLFVQLSDNQKPVAVTEALRVFNAEWTDYKSYYFDDATVARWMNWNNRAATTPTPDDPLGYKTEGKARPENWFDFGNLSDENAEDMFRSFRTAFGESNVARGGSRQIDPANDVSQAVLKSFKVQIGEWINRTVSGRDFSIDDIDYKLSLLQKNFKGVDANGNEVDLLPELGSLIDDFRGLDGGSVNAKVLQEAREAEEAAVNLQRSTWRSQQKDYSKNMGKVVSTLQNYMPEAVSPTDLITRLSNGGPQLINSFRSSMMRTKKQDGQFFTEADLDGLLGDMAVEAIENSVFSVTGRLEVNPRNPNQLIPQYDFDIDKLADFIGFSDPNKAKAMEKIIGASRYNVAKRMVEFIRNKEDSTLGGFSISGIPRKFSVESYISRFYALNRDVIGPQYVATESILQRMRLRNFHVIQQALTDPQVGELFLEMLESGKPLPPKKQREMLELLAPLYVKLSETLVQEQGPISKEGMFGMSGPRIEKLTESVTDAQGVKIFPLHPEFDGGFIRNLR